MSIGLCWSLQPKPTFFRPLDKILWKLSTCFLEPVYRLGQVAGAIVQCQVPEVPQRNKGGSVLFGTGTFLSLPRGAAGWGWEGGVKGKPTCKPSIWEVKLAVGGSQPRWPTAC